MLLVLVFLKKSYLFFTVFLLIEMAGLYGSMEILEQLPQLNFDDPIALRTNGLEILSRNLDFD